MKKQKGQTLLFVVVAVTIALAVGVSVSTRTLNLSRRITRTDTAQRVLAAAEGGVERLLVQPESFLESLEEGTIPDCTVLDRQDMMGDDVKGMKDGMSDGMGDSKLSPEGDSCVVSFPPSGTDKITAEAVVDAEKFSLNSDDHYWFNLEPGFVKEVNLESYTGSIDICWNNTDTAIYYSSYNDSCGVEKGGSVHSAFPNFSDISGFDETASGNDEYSACETISLISGAEGLRIRVLYDSAKIGVYPSDIDSFPFQGYKITSKGKLSVDNEIVDVKTIYVYKSFSYAPAFFDYGLYTTGSIN